MYYSGSRRQGQNCVGFIVNKERRGSVKTFELINERLCKLRVNGKFSTVTYPLLTHMNMRPQRQQKK